MSHRFCVSVNHILSVSNCWVTWLTRFDIFAHASGCTDDRHMLLLHTASEEVQDISATLADTGATYDEAVAVVNAQFSIASESYYSEICFPPRVSES